MPLIKKSSYKKPFYLLTAHIETIFPSLLRRIRDFKYDYFEKVELPDGDFVKVGWKKTHKENDKIVVISHGLEGDAERPYILGTAKLFSENGWDVASWNYRSCGGEMNRLPRLYHHGVSDDLEHVVNTIVKNGYQDVVMVGYSMGGSTTLKYLGEFPDRVNIKVRCAAVFSVPVNLKNSALELSKKSNSFYMNRFMRKLRKKVLAKYEQFNGKIKIDISKINKITTFEQFDTAYTAPLHGFKDSDDFYSKTSVDQFLHNIVVPVLIVNAVNDPMLGEKCYPFELVATLQNVFLETPSFGGHVGFLQTNDQYTWSERRALEFIDSTLKTDTKTVNHPHHNQH